MDLLPIGKYLNDANLGLYLEGREKSIYLYQMPSVVPSGVLIKGPELGTPIDHELIGFHRTDFQVIVRHSDYQKGSSLAGKVSAALNLMEARLGNMHFLYVRPRHLPIVYPVSEGGLSEFSVNFDACYRSISL